MYPRRCVCATCRGGCEGLPPDADCAAGTGRGPAGKLRGGRGGCAHRTLMPPGTGGHLQEAATCHRAVARGTPCRGVLTPGTFIYLVSFACSATQFSRLGTYSIPMYECSLGFKHCLPFVTSQCRSTPTTEGGLLRQCTLHPFVLHLCSMEKPKRSLHRKL